jgi:hypothetical protein
MANSCVSTSSPTSWSISPPNWHLSAPRSLWNPLRHWRDTGQLLVVAQAIAERDHRGRLRTIDWVQLDENQRADYLAMAEAAILAMDQPTEELQNNQSTHNAT